jgi:HD-like signal output (HDOD) protein
MAGNPSLEELVLSCDAVATAPELYTRLEEMMAKPDVTLQQIGALIAEDAGLVGRLLRLTNSSLYQLSGSVDTVDRALAIVGTKQVKELVLANSVLDWFSDLPNDLISMDMFWKHSIACGCAARVIAKTRGLPDVERFYLMGLMHDIGRLVLYGKAPKIAVSALTAAKKDETLLYNVEMDMLGYNHADVGRKLLEQWQLPAAQIAAVGYHHNPSQAGEFILEASITHIADIIANYTQYGSSGERFMPPLDPSAWETLGLAESDLADILAQIESICQDAAQAFLAA